MNGCSLKCDASVDVTLSSVKCKNQVPFLKDNESTQSEFSHIPAKLPLDDLSTLLALGVPVSRCPVGKWRRIKLAAVEQTDSIINDCINA